MIEATRRLESFTYDCCRPEHMWRLEYRDPHLCTDSIPLESKLHRVMDALAFHCLETLQVLDVSCETAKLDMHSYAFFAETIIKFEALRVLCISKGLLPHSEDFILLKNGNTQPYRDLVDYLPPSIEKLHISGRLSYKQAAQLFKKQLTDQQ